MKSFFGKLRGIEEIHTVPSALKCCRQNLAEASFIESLIEIFPV